MDQPEYEHKIRISVTLLPQHYPNIHSYRSIGNFFDAFYFNDKMFREKNNVENVDAIVFPDSKFGLVLCQD